MERIKIIQLVEGLKVGGLERIVSNIALGLDAKGYDVEVWCIFEGGPIADELINKGIKVKILNIDSYYNPLNILTLVNLFKKSKADILHTHIYFANTIGRIAAKLAGIPIIITHVHSTYQHFTKRNLFVERVLSRITDKIICCSKAVKNFVINIEKITNDKVVVVYNGIKVEDSNYDIEQIKNVMSISNNEIVITTVGSLNVHKGQKYLLEAFAEVKKEFENIKCLLVGNGPLKEELEITANKLNINQNVVLLGQINDISPILSITDIFVLPSSEREGLGVAIIEAMAHEKPVIASNIGGIPEVIEDNINGYLVAPKDEDVLTQKIIDLIVNEDKRKEFGRKGKEIYLKKFTKDILTSQIEKIYLNCLKEKQKRDSNISPEKINVLYIHDKCDIGGGEISLLNLWGNLDRNSFEPFLIVPEEGELSNKAKDINVNVFYYAVPKLSSFNLPVIFKTFNELKKFIRENKIKIIHTYTPRNNILGAVLGRFLGISVIWHERNLVLEDEPDFSDKFLFMPDLLICNSNAVAKRFFRGNSIHKKTRVVLNGVNLGRFSPIQDSIKIKQELGIGQRKVVGIISPLTKRKRIEYFLDAAAKVLMHFKDVIFLVVGGEFYDTDIGNTEVLKKQASDLGLDGHILFTGFREDIQTLLSCFDISAHVTEKEACSRAIIESLACGIPVVAMDDGGNPELIENGKTGLLVDPNDLESFVSAIVSLLEDDEKRLELSRNARIRAEEMFDVKRNARETENIYWELINKK